jgi:hypothetical protein
MRAVRAPVRSARRLSNNGMHGEQSHETQVRRVLSVQTSRTHAREVHARCAAAP